MRCDVYLAVGMETRMDDTVHVQVQVIELHAIGIRFRDIDAGVAGGGFIFHHIGNRERISVGEPPVEGWHSHGYGSVRSGSVGPASARKGEEKEGMIV